MTECIGLYFKRKINGNVDVDVNVVCGLIEKQEKM